MIHWVPLRRYTQPVVQLEDVVRFAAGFLLPATHAAARGKPFDATWPRGGPWDVGENE